MIFTTFEYLLEAREASKLSNCLRRQIGVALPVEGETLWGHNSSTLPCPTCHRETCSALHAEVQAVVRAIEAKKNLDTCGLYIWAEVPCHACLSFIKKFSTVAIIYCLSPESYTKQYHLDSTRIEEIKSRKLYARSLGIIILEQDMEEIEEYELSKHTQTHV
jgi:deoxycytidylate deaminase